MVRLSDIPNLNGLASLTGSGQYFAILRININRISSYEGTLNVKNWYSNSNIIKY